MAARFIAILAADATARGALKDKMLEARSPLALVFERASLLVFASPANQVIKIGGGGCVIGHLFQRTTPTRQVKSIDDVQAARIQSSRGDHLRDAFWGGYAAFWTESEGAVVARDPSGHMPVYEFRRCDAHIFTSDVETAIAAGLLQTEIDWDFIPQHLFNAGLRCHRTAIKGVTELLPGFKLLFSPSGERQLLPYWTPWDYIRPLSVSEAEMDETLRCTIRDCVSAWASRYNQILAGVSGGLDSSVIAATLSKSAAHSACLTMATDEPEGDERPYARLLTDALRLSLHEHFHDPDCVDLRRSISYHLPRPMGNFIAQSTEAARNCVANTLPFDAFFSGRGGDNVFCYMQSASPLLDRIKAEGFSKGAWQTLYDICQLSDCSVWDVAKLGLTRVLSGGPGYRWRGQSGFLHPNVIPSKVSGHPWLQAPKGVSIGKAVHVVLLMRIQGTLEGFSRYAPCEQITPLLSQPIMELCLSIPTWVWCSGGINRAPVRRAFAQDLPLSIIERRTKGGPDSFCIEVIERNRSEFKDILLNGQLAAHDLIDIFAIDNCLSANGPIAPPNHLHLATLAEIEAWLNTDRQPMATAPFMQSRSSFAHPIQL